MKKGTTFLKGATLKGKDCVHRVRPLNPPLSTSIGASQCVMVSIVACSASAERREDAADEDGEQLIAFP